MILVNESGREIVYLFERSTYLLRPIRSMGISYRIYPSAKQLRLFEAFGPFDILASTLYDGDRDRYPYNRHPLCPIKNHLTLQRDVAGPGRATRGRKDLRAYNLCMLYSLLHVQPISMVL
jgi:hypothetical protein